MKEADFIHALRALMLHPGSRGLADDCALLEIGTETLVITHDMLVEGRHYLPDADRADVAWKLVASNLSDLAAKGAEPLGVLVGHQMGQDDARFVTGLGEALVHHNVPLLGGDTVAGDGPQSHGLTAIGRALHVPVPARSGAQIGDAIWISGTLGGAMLGYEAMRDRTGKDSLAYRRPHARLAEGQALAAQATAMMDISDGLLLDAFRMATASGASFAIESACIPVAAPERMTQCLTWGDDYALLFTVPQDARVPCEAAQIGTVEPAGFAPLFLDGEPLCNAEGLGYSHDSAAGSPAR